MTNGLSNLAASHSYALADDTHADLFDHSPGDNRPVHARTDSSQEHIHLDVHSQRYPVPIYVSHPLALASDLADHLIYLHPLHPRHLVLPFFILYEVEDLLYYLDQHNSGQAPDTG